MLLKSFLIFISLNINAWAELIPLDTFADNHLTLNRKLEIGYEHFKTQVNASTTVKLSQKPIVDYILALSQYVKTQSVAEALDHLLKTGGSWGISKTAATPTQAYALIAAAKSVQIHHPEIAAKNQDNTSPHYQNVVTAQKMTFSEETNILINAMTSNKTSFFTTNSRASKTKTEFGNDFVLFGFLMGAAPDIHDRYLKDIWGFENAKLETQHNYIQWIFPITTVGMGDGERTPRVTGQTRTLLNGNPALLKVIQQKMRDSVARMATFWGQQLTSENKIIPVVGQEAWQENWIVKTHNYLRMSRILSCLGLFSMKDERDAVWNYLDNVAKKDGRVKDSYDGFWKGAYAK